MTVAIDRFSPMPVRTRMRGREQAREIIRDLLRRATQGAGGVVLVEGETGIGKSLLLHEAAVEATAYGFSLAAGAADQLGTAIPLLALRAALGEPFARFTAGRLDPDVHDGPDWWIGQMRAHLEQRAASAPVLVCVDDVQWACPATLAVLSTLSRGLKRHPVAWVLARSGASHHDAKRLFDSLEKESAVRLSLPPLADDAVAALVTDAFGAPPGQSLMALAADAAGNPSLLVELIGGLRDEDAVRLVDGHAVLTSGELPRRVLHVARQRLNGLSKQARHLLTTAAVIGPSFRLEDAAEMIGETPASLLPMVEETMADGIMIATENAFCFRHQLLCRAVLDLIPQAGRGALHRQYGRLLLSRGEPADRAADHLLLAARPGDQSLLADLDAAIAQTSRSAPRIAADLALRALEVTPPGDPGALPRAVTATEALAAAGRLDEADRFAHDRLANPMPADMEARLRCALSSVLCCRGLPLDAAAEARMALAQPQLSPSLRDQATAAYLRALAESHDEQAGPAADAVLSDPSQRDSYVVAAAFIARAVTSWDKGHISEAVEQMREAARRTDGISRDARHAQPLLTLAAALVDLGQLDEAGEILRTAGSQTTDTVPAQATLSILGARIHLMSGRPADADAAAQEALTTAETLGADGHAADARRVLGLTALRRGDIAAAAHQVACQFQAVPNHASRYSRAETALIQARISEAREDTHTALGHIRQVCGDLASHPGLLLTAGSTTAWLVRSALAAGDAQLAATVARTAETLAAGNPGYPAITAISAHSLGLTGQDPARLAEAAARHPDSWAKAAAAEDLGVLHARQADQDAAIRYLAQAIEGYESAGALADTARVRRRLRELGVRRRHWTRSPHRPATGWESLTETEHKVSELVAQGLNNRQIAAQMHLSSSTVAFHMRQIFRKLGIGSRVDLARIVIQR